MKALLLEDDALWAEMIASTVADLHGETVWVRTTAEIRAWLPKLRQFDVVLLDRMIAGEPADSLGLIQDLRAAQPDLPVVVLSQLGGSARAVEGFHNGADDYVSKPFDRIELGARIRALLRRRSGHFDGAKITAGALQVWPRRRVASYADRELRLQHKPFDVLRFLAENAGSTVSRKALWAEVWPHMNNRPP